MFKTISAVVAFVALLVGVAACVILRGLPGTFEIMMPIRAARFRATA